MSDVAPTAVFLASDDAAYYTGQVLGPNGGDRCRSRLRKWSRLPVGETRLTGSDAVGKIRVTSTATMGVAARGQAGLRGNWPMRTQDATWRIREWRDGMVEKSFSSPGQDLPLASAALSRWRLPGGARIAANDVTTDDLAETVDLVRAVGAETEAFQADVSKSAEVDRAVAAATKRFGEIHILVSNAGIAKKKAFVALTDEEWQRTIDVNLGGAMHCARAVAPQMISRGSGRSSASRR